MQNSHKKIIFVITKSNFGGAQRYVFDLATSLHEEGFTVMVAMGGRKTLFQKLEENGIQVIEIPNMERDISLKKEIRSSLFLYQLFKKETPDIVHLNSSKAGLGALAARLSGVKNIVFTLHGLATNEERPWYQKTIFKFIYRITIRLCHKTIAVSEALKKQCDKELGSVSKKITIIKNGIRKPLFFERSKSLELLQHAAGIDKTKLEIASLTLGTIAELHPIKGHTYLLEGFQKALYRSPVPLYLFMIGDGQEKKNIIEAIETFSLKDNVFLCGHLNDADCLLKAFDMFILPSLSEGLPYVVEEAGSAGLPTIATNVGGIPEIITDQVTGLLIPPKSTEDISESILKLVYDPKLRQHIGENLEKRIHDEFDLERALSQTKKIYNL